MANAPKIVAERILAEHAEMVNILTCILYGSNSNSNLAIADATVLLKRVTNTRFYVRNSSKRALDAIVARIQGEWDHPALKAFGPLSTDTTADILEIAMQAIGR